MDMEEKKLTADAAEQALPVQELPADNPLSTVRPESWAKN